MSILEAEYTVFALLLLTAGGLMQGTLCCWCLMGDEREGGGPMEGDALMKEVPEASLLAGKRFLPQTSSLLSSFTEAFVPYSLL